MAARNKRFTVFDMMEEKGVFEANPANASSPEYAGAKPYPKMLYHPKGETRVLVPAEVVVTPFGPTRNSEQREIINQIVQSPEEEAKLLKKGWHRTPADAIEASGGERPKTSSQARVSELEATIERLQKELAASKDEKAPASAGVLNELD